jgi:transcriptional regulator with XRE-family HTH domain
MEGERTGMGVTAQYVTEDQIRAMATQYIDARGVAEVARELGVSRQFVAMMQRGQKSVSPGMLAQLGATRVTLYEITSET